MKTLAPLCRLCLLALIMQSTAWAVALNVTPAVISNTYPGVVSLDITGLTNLQSVKVQTFLDLNANGLVDAGEPLIDVFSLQESGVTVIGGITNVSAPCDSTPATNAITVALNFAPPMSLENIVGQKIYRVVSNPAGACRRFPHLNVQGEVATPSSWNKNA